MPTLARYGISALFVVALGCTDTLGFEDDTTITRDPSTVGDGGSDMEGLSDAQIAGVMMSANIGETEQGLVALTLARRQDVRDFATQMADELSEAQKRQAALLETLGVRPRTSATSERLRNASERIAVNLLKEIPARLDLTYMRAQVSAHQRLLTLLDQRLISDADHPALRAELSDARARVLARLQAATALRDSLVAQDDAQRLGGNTAGTVVRSGGTGNTGGTTAGTGDATTGGTGDATTGGDTGSASGAGPGFGATGATTGGDTGAGPGFGSGGTSFGTTGASTGSASGAGPGFGAGGTSFGTTGF